MARKIKFSLEMPNGKKVNTIEELQDNFDLEKVMAYFLDGKLLRWLDDRYYDEEAEAVEELKADDSDLSHKLCNIFDVPYPEDDVSVDDLKIIQEKKEKLRQLGATEEQLSHAAQTAFNQMELADLLDADEDTIYLCGDLFTIPTRMTNKHYIGMINKPKIKIRKATKEELKEKKIIFDNVYLPEELQNTPSKLQDEPSKSKSKVSYLSYKDEIMAFCRAFTEQYGTMNSYFRCAPNIPSQWLKNAISSYGSQYDIQPENVLLLYNNNPSSTFIGLGAFFRMEDNLIDIAKEGFMLTSDRLICRTGSYALKDCEKIIQVSDKNMILPSFEAVLMPQNARIVEHPLRNDADKIEEFDMFTKWFNKLQES